MKHGVYLATTICLLLAIKASWAQNVTSYEAIPEPLLFLLREPAVQKDLALTRNQQAQLMSLNEQFDGELLSTRNLAPDKAQPKVAKVLSTTRERLPTILDAKQLQRLRQITYRVRGISFVLTPEVTAELQLSDEQQERIEEIVQTTAESIRALQQQVNDGTVAQENANESAATARKDEQLQVLEQMTKPQRQKLLTLIGPVFDPNRLGQVAFKAPELADTGIWINSDTLQLSHLRGKVVVLHFWAFGCINCIHNYPWYRNWHDKYSDQGVVIIGVHTPETNTERQVDRVREKVRDESLKFPIVVDNDNRIWDAWGNSIWPSVYLIDKQGRLRYWWYGELDWQGAGGQEIMARRIDELLAETH